MGIYGMDLAVDGTDEFGNYAGDGKNAPFVVFDINRQENIAGPFSTRRKADAARTDILNGAKPRLDVQELMAYQKGNAQQRMSPHKRDADSLYCLGMVLLAVVLLLLFIVRGWSDFSEAARLTLTGGGVLTIIAIAGALLTDFSGSERRLY
jgi:hypothetical protein